MIEARGLHVKRGRRAVLQGVDAAFSVGWTAVVGPNGAGKSTLLRALAGLLVPDAGGVRLAGRTLAEWPVRERGRRIAWMAQSMDAASDLSARDVVMLGRIPHLGLVGEPGPQDDAAVDAAMRATECADWARRRLSELSDGERQRVLLARALAVQAPVLLLDEPTAHLDPPHQVALVRLCRALAQERVVVSVLHDLNLALQADRLLVMQAGHAVADGPRGDPALHRCLEAVFDGAIRILPTGPGWMALPQVN
ncbi:MAG: ABC transporter ATP-binding protein [Betaproteobacteria bacterium]